MGTKNNPGEFDCYGNALPDEPMFILLGRDPQAPNLILRWADERAGMITRGERPQSDKVMIGEATNCAAEMILWRIRNDGSWRKK